MTNGLEEAIKAAANKIHEFLENVAEMKVETRHVQVGPNGPESFEQSRLIAQTIVRLDGDTRVVVPLHEGEAGRFEVDTALFELHQRNVTTAIEYRERILNALLSALQGLSR